MAKDLNNVETSAQRKTSALAHFGFAIIPRPKHRCSSYTAAAPEASFGLRVCVAFRVLAKKYSAMHKLVPVQARSATKAGTMNIDTKLRFSGSPTFDAGLTTNSKSWRFKSPRTAALSAPNTRTVRWTKRLAKSSPISAAWLEAKLMPEARPH